MIVLKTNYGAITLELDFEKGPISSANFLQYTEDGFYDEIGSALCRERV